jgi:hypothetical protein
MLHNMDSGADGGVAVWPKRAVNPLTHRSLVTNVTVVQQTETKDS